MLAKMIGVAGAAALLLCASALPAAAQTNSRVGWIADLAGSCWQGRTAAGATGDRHCFQTQFSFVRGTTTSGAERSDFVLGYSRRRQDVEMYTWNARGEASILTPTFMQGAYAFEGATENGVSTRALWRRTDDGFEVADQIRRTGGDWTDGQVTTFARDGAAPALFTAGTSQTVSGSGFEWLGRMAGHCYRQTAPRQTGDRTRGCFAFQYPTVLRQTWYVGNQVTGESVMFQARGDEGVQFFHWEASGEFGVGGSVWDGNKLVSITDTSNDRRVILSRRARGLDIFTEQRTRDPALPWEHLRHVRLRRQ